MKYDFFVKMKYAIGALAVWIQNQKKKPGTISLLFEYMCMRLPYISWSITLLNLTIDQ